MTKQCIDKKKLDLDYQRVFPEVSSYANIWITSDDKSDEEEPTVKDLICTLKIYVFSYRTCGIKGRNISIPIML